MQYHFFWVFKHGKTFGAVVFMIRHFCYEIRSFAKKKIVVNVFGYSFREGGTELEGQAQKHGTHQLIHGDDMATRQLQKSRCT